LLIASKPCSLSHGLGPYGLSPAPHIPAAAILRHMIMMIMMIDDTDAEQ
jgi:hypothetical protein